MAQEQRYYDVQTTASILGLTPAEVNQLREQNRLRGFRDGATWKFRVEDVHQLRRQLETERKQAGAPEPEVEEVLALEPEQPPADLSGSGSVLGLETGRSPGDTDLTLKPPAKEKEELELIDAEPGELHAPPPLSAAEEEIIPLAEPEFTLSDDSVAVLSGPAPAEGRKSESIVEEVPLAGPPSGGSDVKIGHDSGISLLAPHDSGLSLEEEEISLAPSEDEISLGEDQLLTVAADEVSASEAVRPDLEFQLTPGEDEYGLEDSESASQVIALAPEGISSEAPTLVAEEGLGPVFDELGGPAVTPVAEMAAGPAPAAVAELPRAVPAALPEAPFGTLAMVLLTATLLVLVLAGVMVSDLVRNMWSWHGPIPLNSSIMDFLAGLFG
jgi:hypothetical protein